MKQLKIKITKDYIINFFGIILTRDRMLLSADIINHEGIHECQAEDFGNKYLGYCIFYILYALEYFIKLICKLFNWRINPYKSISFEQEAYLNDNNFKYQDTRKRFAWLKYVFKVCK